MRIVVSGVPGIGKTTILGKVSAPEFSAVNFGDVMSELSGMDRDEMRKLPVSRYKSLQEEAAEKIGKMKNVLIDTHISVAKPEGYYPGLPLNVLEKLKPDAIVLLEKDPLKIAEQASKDSTRKRETNPKKIDEHQKHNRMLAAAYSAISCCLLKIIQIPSEESYPFEASDIAARELSEFLRMVK